MRRGKSWATLAAAAIANAPFTPQVRRDGEPAPEGVARLVQYACDVADAMVVEVEKRTERETTPGGGILDPLDEEAQLLADALDAFGCTKQCGDCAAPLFPAHRCWRCGGEKRVPWINAKVGDDADEEG